MEKNLPNSAMKIIASEKMDHCFIVVAYNEQGDECAHGFPASQQERDQMIDNFIELYDHVRSIQLDKEELFLEEEIIQSQVEVLRAARSPFPESFTTRPRLISNIR